MSIRGSRDAPHQFTPIYSRMNSSINHSEVYRCSISSKDRLSVVRSYFDTGSVDAERSVVQRRRYRKTSCFSQEALTILGC
jgi:hypothetical protein